MISNAQIQQVLKQYGDNSTAKKTEKSGGTAAVQRADAVILSQEALNVHQLQKSLRDIPEVRVDRIRTLVEQVESGTYNVSGEEIAEKIIGRIIVDRLV
jgi:negative regulator of flagellin synthesis FlgM